MCMCASVVQQLYWSLGCFVEVSRSRTIRHTHTHTHSRTHSHTPGRAPLNERSPRRRGLYFHNRRISMSCTGFEPATPAIERPQNYALNRTPTMVGCPSFNLPKIQKLNTVLRKMYSSVLIYKVGEAPLSLALEIELPLISGAILINVS
jgi:hypothetical protein